MLHRAHNPEVGGSNPPAKSAQTDIYYLRDAFGPICEALQVTSRKLSAKAKKRPPKPGQDRRRRAVTIEAGGFEQITTAQISEFISGQVRSRGLAPKTANPRATPLEAHELLNAAGRAGHVADGVVLHIPGDIVSIDVENHKLGRKWFELQSSVFAKNDQCLRIDDLIQYVLDLFQASVDPAETLLPYVVSRLPVDDDGRDESALRFVRRSLSDSSRKYTAVISKIRGMATRCLSCWPP